MLVLAMQFSRGGGARSAGELEGSSRAMHVRCHAEGVLTHPENGRDDGRPPGGARGEGRTPTTSVRSVTTE